MIRKLTSLLLVLCLLPAAALAETLVVTGALRDDMPPFTFTLTYRQGSTADAVGFYYTSAIEVSSQDGKQIIQHIALNPEAQSYEAETLGFVLEDMNFDGYQDMRIIGLLPAGANVPYICFLWNPASNQFAFNEALTQLSSPSFDPVGKLVHSADIAGGGEYIDATYTFVDGALTLVGRVTTTYDVQSGIVFTTTEELLDGQMRVTNKTEEPWGGLDDPIAP